MTADRPRLRAVSGELPEPPYPAETKSNGFRPELDWARVKSSKTWRLCPPEARNHLLRLWLESWNEIPAGSWEDDDEIIAIAIDVNPTTFTVYRPHLMRGWERHSDGRLYHPFVTGMVETMIGRRRKSTERVARHRAAKTEPKSAGTGDKKKREATDSNALHPVTYTKEQEQEQEQDISTPPKGVVVGQPPSGKPNISQKTSEEIEKILSHLNAKTGSQFETRNRAGKLTKNAELVKARLAEHGMPALIAVIDNKTRDWINDPKMSQYLRPATLFAASKCEQYVGQSSRRDPIEDWITGGNDSAIPGEFTRE